jgi:hypothetical protein
MPSVCLESSIFFVLVPVAQLASPLAVHAAQPPVLEDGVRLRDGKGFLQRSGMLTRPSIPFARKSPPLSLFLALSIFDSGAKLHAASTFFAGAISPCLVVVRRVIGTAPARTRSSMIVGTAGVAVVTALRVLIVTTAASKSVGIRRIKKGIEHRRNSHRHTRHCRTRHAFGTCPIRRHSPEGSIAPKSSSIKLLIAATPILITFPPAAAPAPAIVERIRFVAVPQASAADASLATPHVSPGFVAGAAVSLRTRYPPHS